MKNICLLILFCALLLSACVTPTFEIAGKVNGRAIPYSEYMAEFRNRYEAFSVQNNRPPSSEEKDMLMAQTWQNITKDVILKQQFRKYGITATMQEAIDTLKANPPMYIKTSPLFTVGGKFYPAGYHQSLEYDRPENLSMLKRQYQTYYVPIARLKKVLLEEQMLSASEKKRVASIVSGSADIDWVLIDPTKLDVVITDSEVKSFYEAKKERWALEPKFALTCVALPIKPSLADSLYAKTLIDSLAQAANDPKGLGDFLAAHSLVSARDSGYVFLMDLEAGLKNMLATLGEGGISSPILTDSGWQIVQLEQMTKSMVKYISFSVPILAGQQSANETLPKANQLRDLSKQLGTQKAAEEMGLKHLSYPDLTPADAWIDDPAFVAMVASSLQTAQKGHVFEPRYYAATSSWLVVQLSDNQNQRFAPLEDVETLIVAELRLNRQKEIAVRTATDWLSKKPLSAADANSLPGTRILSQSNVNITSKVEGSPIRDIYFNALELHLTKQARKSYTSADLVLIPFVRAFRPGANKSTAPQNLYDFYSLSLGENWFDQWMDRQVNKASVRIMTAPVQ